MKVRYAQRSPSGPRPGRPTRDLTPHLDRVRELAAGGASLSEIGRAIGTHAMAVKRLVERHGIELARPRASSHPLLILIPPVREAGPGIVHSGGFDMVDTGEL